MMQTDIEELHDPSPLSESIPPLQLAFAIALAPLSGITIVAFSTVVIQLISQEIWSQTPIIWPPALYIGAIIGGIIGGVLTYYETSVSHNKSSSLSSVQVFSPDVLYIGLLGILTFVLETLSESLIFQAMFFFLEIAWLAVFSRNISKYALKLTISDKSDKQE